MGLEVAGQLLGGRLATRPVFMCVRLQARKEEAEKQAAHVGDGPGPGSSAAEEGQQAAAAAEQLPAEPPTELPAGDAAFPGPGEDDYDA